YTEMEQFLVPSELPREDRIELMGYVHRAGDDDIPAKVDLVLYQDGVRPDRGAFTYHPGDPDCTIDEILRERDEESLALAREFPAFRKPVVDRIILAVARENAFFAVATALPNIVPSLIELPWAFGEFASDTAFL